jgi:BirA family biotin operon repressor/biotin-[acetyl-CoA-carboxylase] ligase
MSLDIQQLQNELSRLSLQTGIPIYGFNTLPSTDRTASEFLEAGREPPFAVIADRQTAGKGQYGRQWVSETGGLYLSLALAVELDISLSPCLVLATAWGIASGLRAREIPVGIKWPNDLVIDGRKLGGIKIETRVRGEKITRAVIGVGINWCNPVPETGINLRAFFTETGKPAIPSLEQLAAIAIAGILSGYENYSRNGVEAILAGYLPLFVNLGQAVTIDDYTGIITGVNDRGQLKVRTFIGGASAEICLPAGTIGLGYNR